MKAIYIYNPHSELERNMLERARTELGNNLEELEVIDFESAKDRFKIRATPALILVRDDLQGTNLLDEVNGQLRIVGELYKALEEEDLNIHQAETNRIDNVITSEVTIKFAEKQQILDDALSLLTETGVI